MILSDAEIERLSIAGASAPSAGNAQPWLVAIDGNTLSISLDPTFLKRASHPYIAGGVFSLGMFSENICISAEAQGLEYQLKILDPTDLQKPCAIFTFSARGKVYEDSSASLLETLIAKRSTNRKPHDGSVIPPEQIQALKDSMNDAKNTCVLGFVSEKNLKKTIVEDLATAEALRVKNDTLFHAMLEEVRWNKKEAIATKDGIDIATLELSTMDLLPFLILRKYSFLRRLLPLAAFKSLTRKYLMSSSTIGCVGVNEAITHRNLFIAGKASQRLWLIATHLGIALQPWTGLPLMTFDIENEKSCFGRKEVSKIKFLYRRICDHFSEGKRAVFPIFIFRLFKNQSTPERALRKDWQSYTTINQES